MIKKATVDICIMGGGITGLWALNRLKKLGYSVVLFETNALGSGQTICSQGIIHGGLKYALTGFLTKSSHSIEEMPKRWKSCLEGLGEIDLSDVKILSNDQFLWSTGSLTSDLTTFFASKTLSSRIQKLKTSDYPNILQNEAFKGNVYRLDEIVLDVPSLVDSLAKKHLKSIFKIDTVLGFQFHENNAEQKTLKSVIVQNQDLKLELTAQHYLFSAGEGNAKLLELCGISNLPKMQCRPLHMVLVSLPHSYPFYAHCIDNGSNPRITITSHMSKEGKQIWYLGGQIAEEGVKKNKQEQVMSAKKELKDLFPWLNLEQAQFSSFFINRAEIQQKEGKRPESFYLEQMSNLFIAWPTKLALAPLLCDQLIHTLKDQKIVQGQDSLDGSNLDSLNTLMKSPNIATPIWNDSF